MAIALSDHAAKAASVPTDARPGLVRDLWALTKPRVTLLVLLTAAGALAFAPGELSLATGLWALIGTTLVVGSANALNCWLERDSDGLMSRTKSRPLPAGRLSPDVALWFGLALGVISVPMLALLVNPLTGLLGAFALVSYVWIYTPLKRHSWLALIVGAIPGAMPPLMGWTARTGSLDAPGLVLFAVLFVWQLPHFMAIATFRKDEYSRAGIRVLPAVRGVFVTRLHAITWAAALVPVSLLLVPLGEAGLPYLIVMGLAGLLFLGLTVRGLFAEPSAAADGRWARGVFFASLLYLPLLYGALFLDGLVRVAAG
jgi:protoheme IX farnesyltransferase